MRSTDVLSVGQLDVVLADHGVLHSGVNFSMAEQALHLFDGHSLVDGAGSQRSSEFMGVDFFEAQQFSKTAQADFHAADFQAGMRFVQRYEKRGILIGTAGEVVFQMDFRTGIKINRAFLVSLSENDALPVFKINVGDIQMHQFSYAHPGGRKHIDHSQIAQMGTAVPHHLHGLVGIGFLDGLVGADFVNSADGAFEDIVFVLQPCEKAGKNAANIVDIAAAASASLLIIRQILAQIVRCDMHDALIEGMQQLGDGSLVIMQRLFTAPLPNVNALIIGITRRTASPGAFSATNAARCTAVRSGIPPQNTRRWSGNATTSISTIHIVPRQACAMKLLRTASSWRSTDC